jgi:hypothetical protein
MLTKLYLIFKYKKLSIIIKTCIKYLKRARRISLENLALALIKSGIKWRVDICSLSNFNGIKSSVKNAILKSGESLFNIRSPSPNKKLEKAKYCDFCNRKKGDACENRNKFRITCQKCSKVICPDHTFSYCTEHKLN